MSFLMIHEKSEMQRGAGREGRSEDDENSIGGVTSMIRPDYRKRLKADSSSVINFYPKWCQCFQCVMAKKYGRHENVPCCERCQNAFRCPPQGSVSRIVYFIVINLAFCGFMWGLDADLAVDAIFPLVALELTGLFFGMLMKVIGFPALLAPLLIGIALNNIPHLHFFDGLTKRHWIESIREIALTIILTRAGIELSPKQLKKLKGIVPLAAFGPCIVEACTCGGLFYFFFHKDGIPIAMCFVAGFALSAVSPAVVVPGMLTLNKKGYGVKEGIPTLLIAASSIDDVLAISAFSVLLNFVEFKSDGHWTNYAGIIGLPVGLVHGLIVGIFLHFIPSKDMGRPVPYLRLVLLLLLNLVCTFGYNIDALKWLSGAGSVGVLATSFIASFGWRSVPHWKYSMTKIVTGLAHIWTLCVPMLFGTIGREINLRSFDWQVVGRIVAIIFICLTVRCITMFLICCCLRKTNCKERVFCALSWIPKATVQAALAPLVISQFQDRPHLLKHAKNVVLLAVFGILITAPLGAILISLLGTKMLRKAVDEPDEFPNGEGLPEFDKDDGGDEDLKSLKSAPPSGEIDFNTEGEENVLNFQSPSAMGSTVMPTTDSDVKKGILQGQGTRVVFNTSLVSVGNVPASPGK